MAPHYHRGRALGQEALASWRDAVTPFVPAFRPLRVLDLGAGTGVFTRAWVDWFPTSLVAVEPAAGMRGEATRPGLPRGVDLVGGVGERLPLRSGSVDVGWLSAVVHHFDDLARCARELHRVVVADGPVLIRELFADRGRGPGWLRFFPQTDHARAHFPTTATTLRVFTEHGFELLAWVDVEEPVDGTVGDAVPWIREMRHADTLLRAFTDEEVDGACEAIASRPADELLAPTELTLLALRRRG